MKMPSSPTARQFMDDLLGQGRYTFTRDEAAKQLNASRAATYMALHRLGKAGRLAMPRSGFYVIVDPQHRVVGTLPPEWFIHALMKDMDKPYYVGLLSAAQQYGAAHHRPQEFQVVIPTRRVWPIQVGNVRIRFFGKGPFDRADMIDVKTPTGFQKVSTPETTAWDLVRYSKAAGGIENVITVLSELSERLERATLLSTIKRHGDVLVAQRLGYLLDRLNHRHLSQGLADWVKQEDAPYRLLGSGSPVGRALEDSKWRLKVNVQLEPET